MRDRVTEKQISAYLDGELSGDERELVERAVAESEEHRRLLAELQELRARVQALPRLQLPADFSARVVQQIEDEKLSPAVATPRPNRAAGRRTALKRLAAGAASLAAVIALILAFRPPPEQPSVDGPPPTPLEPVWIKERPKIVMVYDVTLTARGEKQQAFENLLKQLGIALDPSLKLDGELEDDLLAIRMDDGGLLGTKAVPYKGDKNAPKSDERDTVEMIYISSTVGTLGNLGIGLEQLEIAGKHVSAMDYGLVFEEKKLKILRRLHESVVNEFAQEVWPSRTVNGHAFNLTSADSAPAGFSLPHREADRNAGAGLGGAMSSLNLGGGESDSKPDDVEANGAGQPVAEGMPTDTDNQPAHVLVILRKPAETE